MENGYYLPEEHKNGDTGPEAQFRKPTVRQTGILYLVVTLLFLFIGSRAQRFNFHWGVLITEFILILIPPIALLFIQKYDIVKNLRINRISILNILLTLLLMIFSMPLVLVLNLANLMLIKSVFGRILVPQPPTATDLPGLIANILVIGVAAGICEEVLFRGTIQRGLEKYGVLKSILLTSFLFGLMHMDFQKLFGTFLLGALIGFIVYRTNSIFGGMIAHFTNNSIGVLLAYFSYRFMEEMGDYSKNLKDFKGQGNVFDYSNLINMPRIRLIAVLIVWTLFIAFCMLAFWGLMTAFIKNTAKITAESEREAIEPDDTGKTWLIPGILIIGFLYIAEGFRLKGISIHWIDTVLKVMGLR